MKHFCSFPNYLLVKPKTIISQFYIVSNVKKYNFPLLIFSDTWRVTSPEKEKEIPPLRVVSQSCVSLSLKKKSKSWNEKKAEDRFSHQTRRNDEKHNQGDHICTQLPSRIHRMMMHTLFYPLIFEQQIYSLIFSSKATKVFLSPIFSSLSLSLSLSLNLSFFIALPILYMSYIALF